MRQGCRITILTGAGVSAASSIPTFRGPGGLWRTHRPESLATAAAFKDDPKLVWEWYNWRREVIAGAQPNPAHAVLTLWSRRYPGFTLVTQNVDGLHERSGTANVIRFHGSIWEVRCWNRCASAPPRWLDHTVPLSPLPPRCPYCSGLLRPGVVWFGESIDPEVLQQSLKGADCDVFMTIGTSSLVYPAASLVRSAKKQGALTVEINVEPTPAADVIDLFLEGPAEQILADIERRLAG